MTETDENRNPLDSHESLPGIQAPLEEDKK